MIVTNERNWSKIRDFIVKELFILEESLLSHDFYIYRGIYRANCPLMKCSYLKPFIIDPYKQIFYCLNCKKGGDIITYVCYMKDITYDESISYLINKYKLKIPSQMLSEIDNIHDIFLLSNLKNN